jgi:hypothetical protein
VAYEKEGKRTAQKLENRTSLRGEGTKEKNANFI